MTTTPDPASTLSGTLALGELTDDQWLNALHDDTPPTAELVAVPTYTQSEWDRQAVRWIRHAENGEDYLWANLDKPDELLIYDLLLLTGRHRAARDWAAGAFAKDGVYIRTGTGLAPVDVIIEGEIRYAEVTPAPKPVKPAPKRRRPSQARKTIAGGK